jgi:glyoxylase-like metal-dependent hydrolase (beta-lactamase superfamily II)
MTPQRLGSIEVRKVTELDRVRVDPRRLYANLPAELLPRCCDDLGPSLMAPDSGDLYLSYHSYVVRTRHHTIVVDTCIGNGKDRRSVPEWHDLQTPYLARLAEAGVHPDDVDVVLCTHLHADHVGWNTRLVDGRWVPTFRNARYVMAEPEYAHYAAQHAAASEVPVNRGSFADSVLPIVESGQATLVQGSHAVELDPDSEVRLEPAAGHTPGNVTIALRGGGREALLSGDVIHHPIQLALPWLDVAADHDGLLAAKTRHALLERCADTDILVLTGHFPDPTAGRVRRAGGAYTFAFIAD